ncbi:MAG: hypothetical protein GQ531_08610 [Sulfurovum sp.]|nr:hypothetical protein [Sulfurovum sp.]
MIVIESIIKSNALGRWYIELEDTMKEEDLEHRVVCLDINEYAEKIEIIGAEYGGDIEVAWSSEENVSPEQINEVRAQIMAYEAEQEAQNSEVGPSDATQEVWSPTI